MTTGRPIALTAEIARKLSEALRSGASVRAACGVAGISPDTYKNWLKAGREGDPRFTAFSSLMSKARSEPEVEAYSAIKAHFDDWKAAARFLELRDPNRWKKKEKKGESTGSVDVNDLIKKMMDEEADGV